MDMVSDTALRCHCRRPNAKMQLFAFPCAGGKPEFFDSWSSYLPQTLEIWAIRWPESNELANRDARSLIAQYAQAISAQLSGPFVFFGYSIGGKVAYEVACFLREYVALQPQGMWFAATPAPFLPWKPSEEEACRSLLTEMKDLPPDLFKAEAQLSRTVESFRREIACWRAYRGKEEEAPFQCPITVLGGWHDRLVSYQDLVAWRAVAQGPYAMRMFAGGHFFPFTHTPELLEQISHKIPVSS